MIGAVCGQEGPWQSWQQGGYNELGRQSDMLKELSRKSGVVRNRMNDFCLTALWLFRAIRSSTRLDMDGYVGIVQLLFYFFFEEFCNLMGFIDSEIFADVEVKINDFAGS